MMDLYGDFAKVSDRDDGTIEVHGIASSPSRDDANEVITADAMRGAIDDYLKWGAVREMHGPSAAGTALEMNVGDDGKTRLVAHVVDPVAIAKVKSGVYKGFSIGGKVVSRDPADRRTITKINLIEVSLVDRPCNPEAQFEMWKADMSLDKTGASPSFAPPAEDVRARATEMAKAAGKPPKRYVDFLYKARELMRAEHEEAIAKAADEALPTASTETAVEGEAEVNKSAETEGSPGDEDTTDIVANPADVLKANLEAIDAALKAPVAPAKIAEAILAQAITAEALTAFAESVKKAQGSDKVEKGLWTLGRVAELMAQMQNVAQSVTYEAASEADGSPQPALAKAALQAIADLLQQMAVEEVAEALAAVGDVETIELAAPIMDLVKADTAAMGRAAARFPKEAAPDSELIEKVSVLEADKASLEKTILDATDFLKTINVQVDALRSEYDARIEELSKRLDAYGDQPLSPKTLGHAAVYSINKAQDANGAPLVEEVTPETVQKYLASLSEEDRGLALIKLSRTQPKVLQQ